MNGPQELGSGLGAVCLYVGGAKDRVSMGLPITESYACGSSYSSAPRPAKWTSSLLKSKGRPCIY